MLGLQGEGATHVEIYRTISLGLYFIDKVAKLFQTLKYDLRHYGHALIVLGIDVSTVLGADVACLYTYEGGVVAFDAANELVVDAAVHVIGMALQWGKVNGSHRLQRYE